MSDNLRIKRLREHGARLGRPGISGRIHALVDAYVSAPSYLAAIALAGRLRVLSMAASADQYWNEKTTNGMVLEAYDIANVERPDDESDDGIRSPSPLTFTAVDSLATQLEDAKQVIVTLRATMEQMRRERDEARAKLARIREVAECDYHDTPRTVLRIIDEKEGGQ